MDSSLFDFKLAPRGGRALWAYRGDNTMRPSTSGGNRKGRSNFVRCIVAGLILIPVLCNFWLSRGAAVQDSIAVMDRTSPRRQVKNNNTTMDATLVIPGHSAHRKIIPANGAES